jgi:protein-S-isoprenylcysteine O-methyltransferase Ste14
MTENSDSANAAFHPPVLLLGLLVAGSVLWRTAALAFLPDSVSRILGPGITGISFIVFWWSVLTMLRAGATLPTHKPSTVFVAHGPYQFSRNPIYAAMLLLIIGIACWLNSAWFLIVAAVFLGLITSGVIVREEQYLSRIFGTEYDEYCASVRRWI